MDTNCFLVADLDVYNQVRETSKTDNVSAAPLSGVFQTGDGTVYAFTAAGSSSAADTVLVSQDPTTGNVTVGDNGVNYTFASVSGVTIATPTGDNTINGAVNGNAVSVPLTIYGGAGSDVITGGDGGDTIYGGAAGGNTITGGDGGNTIYGGAGGGNTIYAGNGGDTIYGGAAGGSTIHGGNGGDTIYTAAGGGDTMHGGNGNDTIYGRGTRSNTITDGNGNDQVFGGSGSDNITVGDGDDWVQAGNSIIKGGNAPSSSDVVSVYGFDFPTAADPNAVDGEYYYYTPPDPNNLSDASNRMSIPVGGFSADYGWRLGEDLVTQAAVYGRWDSSAAAPSGSFWTHDAWYSIYDTTSTNERVLVDTVQVDQASQCGGSGQPWQILSGPNALSTGTYNSTGYVSLVLSNYDPRVNSTDNGDGGTLYVNATMFQPLWPTLTIAAVGQGTQPTVTPADPYQYAAWQDSWQPIQIPVEGEGNRTEIDLHAAINQLYSNVTDWSAVLPNIPGLDFWASATTPTQLSADANGNLIDQAFSSNGTFDETVWVSEDPTYAATGAPCPSITLDAEATIGDPETEELSDAVPTTPRATGHLPQVCFVPTDQINLTKDFGQSPIVIENTVRTEAIEYFLKQTKTTIGEWTSIEVSSDADLAVGSAGYAGILRTVMSKAAYVHQSGGSVSYGCDFSGSKIGFMAYAVTLKQQTGGSFSFEGVPIPAPPTSEHELWHTDGARPSPTPFAIAKRLGETPPSARKGYVYGAHAVVTKLMNSILKPLLSYPDDHPSARNDAWCLRALNYCFDQYYMDKAVGAWIIDNGSYHTGPGGTQWNTQGNEKTGQVRLSEDRRDCTSCSLPISDLAGWPWAVARPGLPQIRTWTH